MPVRAPHSPADFAAYYQLRYQVLRQPWQQPPGSERADDDDAPTTMHALYTTPEGHVAGVARQHPSGPRQIQVRYMAVDPAFQGQGIGRQLLAYLEAGARQQGYTECILHARQEAVPFYERLGYHVVAPSHLLFGSIQHFLMRKEL
ncbi:GNAT family N-acetyltransferase [Hymenobacter chitinivorans]|uniref:Putative GNAT family N-acyltransferase n=1 Tax=Hymenobacter chitinivorans DSM 11115 TaxID=1121954 RepID=A0A2M9B957_9BACT|nr:GNAT family N-acetyltransferase [Hymenobacter chitinivorans]PJJ54482.1 putative GNAT family N-acyltransferase [Hymenobacter chitinivorans DSM 11115]